MGQRVDSIYATNTKRTINTAKPTADSKNLPVNIYANNAGMLQQLRANNKAGNFLIVGHSNTVPDLLRSCNCTFENKNLYDNEYNRFFMMTLKWKKGMPRCKLKQQTF